MPAALRPPSPEAALAPAPRGGVAADVARDGTSVPREGPSIAAVLAGLACLLLAMGVGVLIGRGAGEPVAQTPVPVAAAGATTTAAPATASFTNDWPAGKEGWTVALSLLPAATTTPAAVARAKSAATAKGAAAAGALDSSAYPSLTTGSYVVYSGVFDTEAAATSARAKLAAAFPDSRVVRVGKADAPAAGSTTSKGSTPKPKSSGSSKRKTAGTGSAPSDTSSEVEKSKKAPKTVGTGGKPPPKDNKPAAGGGPSEEIG
jgi:hypothetical protein